MLGSLTSRISAVNSSNIIPTIHPITFKNLIRNDFLILSVTQNCLIKMKRIAERLILVAIKYNKGNETSIHCILSRLKVPVSHAKLITYFSVCVAYFPLLCPVKARGQAFTTKQISKSKTSEQAHEV
jgi:hypothetical protein